MVDAPSRIIAVVAQHTLTWLPAPVIYDGDGDSLLPALSHMLQALSTDDQELRPAG